MIIDLRDHVLIARPTVNVWAEKCLKCHRDVQLGSQYLYLNKSRKKPMKNYLITAKLSALAILCATTAFAQDVNYGEVVATVNGDEIYMGDVLALLDQLPPEYQQQDPAQLMPQLVDQLVSQKLISDEANAEDEVLKYKLRQAERATELNSVLDAYIAENLTDEYLQTTYDEVIGGQAEAEEFNASHILVESEDAAKDVEKQLTDGADFAELAKTASTGPSGPKGGELGWFGKGQMVPEFEAAVAAMEKGAISEPIKTQFGWHVIKLNDKRVAEKPTMEAVADQLREFATQKLMEEKIASIKADADVKVIEGVDAAALKAQF